MGFFESLKQQFPEVVAHNSKSPAAKRKKHPRAEVLELIDHSIRYLENPNFRVKYRHNNEVAPLLCYEFTGERHSQAYLSGRQARHRRWK